MQKYNVNQKVILLDAVSNKPVASSEIISYNESQKTYRIRYQISGDETFWIDDVGEERLITNADIVKSVS